jgi:ABC-2 type transport system ATP-binding protein
MIVIENASRWYGQVIGVNDVSTTIGPGITALLGMNGAGKSTLMRLITGQLRPTTGSIKVFDMDPFANPEVFRKIGYCPEIDNFYEDMTGRDFVRYMARLQGFSARDASQRAEQSIGHVGMTERANKKIKSYSKGMRQRIKLAQAMVHDPEIILLDEPLNGLDPVARHEFLEVLGEFVKRGKTVVVSSHILYEVEQMTRSILLLHRGRLLATGDLRVIRDLIDKYPHKVRIETTEPRKVASKLTEFANVVSTRIDEKNQRLDIEVRHPNAFYDVLGKLLINKELSIQSFTSPDNNLESVFQYLVEG